MRYFIDTEYNWDSLNGIITPISIGIVADDGREFYAVDANWEDSAGDVPSFVREVVVPALAVDAIGFYVHGERATIARDLKAFVRDVPEFWGDYAAFDYVVLSMLMGGFDDWPEGWPMHINDCQQVPGLDVPESLTPHNALADARAIRDGYDHFWGY